MLRKSFPIASWRVLSHALPSPLRSVVTGQEIRASRFELWQQLLRKLQFDFRIGFAKHSKKSREAERWTVLHHLRVRCVCQLFCFGECVVQFAKTVDELILQCFFPGENSAIGDRIAQKISREISLLRHDAKKLVIR